MPPSKDRLGTWISNGRLSIYMFLLIFGVYTALYVWARIGHGPPPDGLIPLVTAAFGFAVTMNSADRRTETQQKEVRADENERRIDDLEEEGRLGTHHKESMRRHDAADLRADVSEERTDDLEHYAHEDNPLLADKVIKPKDKRSRKSGDPDE